MAEAVFVVDARDLAGLREKLATGEFALGPAREFVARSAHQIRAEIVQRTPVDTGRLRASVAVAIEDQGLTGIIGSNVQYAPHVEFGTRPHFPPPAALQPWAQRHGFPAGKKGAYLVARAIARRGTKPRMMFQRGLAAAQPFIDAEARRALDEMGQNWQS